MESNPFIYDLSETLEYTKDGDFSKTASLEFVGPSMSCFDLSSQLSQLVMRAMLDAQDFSEKFKSAQTSQAQAQEIDGKAVKMILLASKSIAFAEVAEVAKNLFVKVGTYDGKTKLKKVAFDKIMIDDFIEIVCGYIANFIIPSLF